MNDLDLFRRQFLFTIHENFDLPWRMKKIWNMNLFYHPDLEFESSENSKIELCLLGFIFDYEHPEYSNKQIINSLSKLNSFDHFLDQLSKYSGHFAIIYKSEENLIILNDACAQLEIYYDTSFSSFGSQPKLLGKIIPLSEHSSPETAKFYSSSAFLTEKIYIGNTTHVENVLHLTPNHYIDIVKKRVFRYFPRNPICPMSINEAAEEAIRMIKGFIKAASIRNKLYMAVTGGYDSRVLFLSSLDVDCKYYVTKLEEMDDLHYDIVLPKKLTEIFKREFKVILENPADTQESHIQEKSVDFSRGPFKPDKEYVNHTLINGNLSEIARNYFGYYKNILPKELAVLYGYPGNKFVCKEYEKWLESSSILFSEYGYNVLDMFYWEEKMGNWAAKAKTEMGSSGTIIYSPFCSHKLLTILLSTPRKYRDEYRNKLYDSIIKLLGPDATKVPINPSKKKWIVLLLKKLKLFNIIQIIRLRFRALNT